MLPELWKSLGQKTALKLFLNSASPLILISLTDTGYE